MASGVVWPHKPRKERLARRVLHLASGVFDATTQYSLDENLISRKPETPSGARGRLNPNRWAKVEC